MVPKDLFDLTIAAAMTKADLCIGIGQILDQIAKGARI
jgi:hypothetical protein